MCNIFLQIFSFLCKKSAETEETALADRLLITNLLTWKEFRFLA